MTGKTQETLIEAFGGLFDRGPAEGSGELMQSLGETVKDLGQAVTGMTSNAQAGAAVTSAGANVRGGAPATSTDNGPGAGSIATTFLEGGMGIVPLITGLIGLFGGGTEAPPPLEKYAVPPSLSFLSAETTSGLTAADFDQTGAPRLYRAGPGVASTAAPGGGSASPQITVNVQAMDARSFLDYSGEIAQAVRGAMLNLSSLNDVVNEL